MELGEMIAVAIGKDAAKPSDPCWFCKEKGAAEGKTNEEKAHYDTSDGDPIDAVPENKEDNDSSRLGENLEDRPVWIIDNPLKPGNPTTIGPGAHHCIPGGASLAKATDLHKFMRGGDIYESDIGYNVNHENNGVWLPGNYAVRADNAEFDNRTWSSFGKTVSGRAFQIEYVKRAMEEAGGRQFHDAHRKYNGLAKKSLISLAAKMKDPKDKECPICGETKKNKARPPFALVQRLDRVSRRYRRMLVRPKKKLAGSGFFTSSKVKKVL